MTDEANADFTAAVQAAYQAARKTYGDQRYQEGVNDGKAKATADAEATGVRLAIEFLEEFTSAATDELRKRYGIEDSNAKQPIQSDNVEPEVVELAVTGMVTVVQPPEPTIVEPEAGTPMEAPATTQPTMLTNLAETATSLAEEPEDANTASDKPVYNMDNPAPNDMLLSKLQFSERLSHSRLIVHFKTVGDLCKVPSEEALGGYHRVGKTIVDDTVLALEEVGRWLNDGK